MTEPTTTEKAAAEHHPEGRPPGMPPAPQDMRELLALERIEVDLFRGIGHEGAPQRVFGGHVAAQAVMAAGKTVESAHRIHSCHAYFLRPGDPSIPLVYTVDRTRDGRTFSTRRVVALQHGKAVFHLAASFQEDEDGPVHQVPTLDVPGPDQLPSAEDWLERTRGTDAGRSFARWYEHHWKRYPVDIRFVGEPPAVAGHHPDSVPHQQLWFRAQTPLGDEPLLQAAAFTFTSDLFLLGTILLGNGGEFSRRQLFVTSLDHAIWFHEPFRADEWFFYDQRSPRAGRGRGFTRGEVFNRSGTLVASVAQEGLLRVLPETR